MLRRAHPVSGGEPGSGSRSNEFQSERAKVSEKIRLAAKVDAVAAVIFTALFGWSVHASHQAAEDAIQRYGHNVDSGAVQAMVGTCYFAPLAILFVLAAVLQWRGWRIGRYVHYFAFTCFVAPFALILFGAIRGWP